MGLDQRPRQMLISVATDPGETEGMSRPAPWSDQPTMVIGFYRIPKGEAMPDYTDFIHFQLKKMGRR
jgi:hypothetical protein